MQTRAQGASNRPLEHLLGVLKTRRDEGRCNRARRPSGPTSSRTCPEHNRPCPPPPFQGELFLERSANGAWLLGKCLSRNRDCGRASYSMSGSSNPPLPSLKKASTSWNPSFERPTPTT